MYLKFETSVLFVTARQTYTLRKTGLGGRIGVSDPSACMSAGHKRRPLIGATRSRGHRADTDYLYMRRSVLTLELGRFRAREEPAGD